MQVHRKDVKWFQLRTVHCEWNFCVNERFAVEPQSAFVVTNGNGLALCYYKIFWE